VGAVVFGSMPATSSSSKNMRGALAIDPCEINIEEGAEGEI